MIYYLQCENSSNTYIVQIFIHMFLIEICKKLLNLINKYTLLINIQKLSNMIYKKNIRVRKKNK